MALMIARWFINSGQLATGAVESGGDCSHRPIQVRSDLLHRLVGVEMIVNVGFKFGQFVIHIVMTFYRFVLQSQASLSTLDNTSNIDRL